MVYAGWTKGSTALLLAIAAASRRLGVEDALRAEWESHSARLARPVGGLGRAGQQGVALGR